MKNDRILGLDTFLLSKEQARILYNRESLTTNEILEKYPLTPEESYYLKKHEENNTGSKEPPFKR